jgi:hypothetical protein
LGVVRLVRRPDVLEGGLVVVFGRRFITAHLLECSAERSRTADATTELVVRTARRDTDRDRTDSMLVVRGEDDRDRRPLGTFGRVPRG